MTKLELELAPGIVYTFFCILEKCFSFLIHCWPIRARDVSHFRITKKRKSVISPILQEIF